MGPIDEPEKSRDGRRVVLMLANLFRFWRSHEAARAFAALAMLWPVSSLAGPASDAVKFFYRPPNFEVDPAVRERFVDPARAVFEANEKLSNGGQEVGCIDFVLAIDAQDYDDGEIARTLTLSEEVFSGEAEVRATFRLFPDDISSRREILWSLRNVDGEWKVSDIESLSGDWRLSKFDCQ